MNEYVVTINGKKVQIILSNENKAVIDGKEFMFSLSRLNSYTYRLGVNNKLFLISAKRNGSSDFILTINGQLIETKVLSALQEKAANLIESKKPRHSSTTLKSPMPGMILKIKRKPGEEITQGDSLLLLEAMKMENDITAPLSGKIKEILVKEGQAVEKNAALLIID
jgi:biotin carboxyl carrier protein